jgi:sulfate-transporting ATPase
MAGAIPGATIPGTVVAMTHDRYFLDNAAGWILELDRGEGIPWKGNYSSWLEQKEARLEQEAKQIDAARASRSKKELEWVRQNPKGRQAKSKARIARFEELNSQEYQKRNETQELFIPPGPRLGDEGGGSGEPLQILRRPAADRRSLLHCQGAPSSASSVRTARVNPPCSSMITGKEQPDSGDVKIGPSVLLAHPSISSRDTLDNNKTVFDAISGGNDILTVGKYTTPARAYIGRFNFKGGDQQKIIGQLSGGERGRLHLAQTLISGGNVLLLDEPTNDLDVETCAPSKTLCWSLPVAYWSSPTTAGSSTVSPPTSSPRKANRNGPSSTATTRNTKPTRKNAWVKKALNPNGYGISRLVDDGYYY